MSPPKNKARFVLAKEDLTWGEVGHRSGGSASARVGRASAATSRTVFIEHLPTKVRVEGTVQEGNYSKKEMQRLRAQLYDKLLTELETAVARKLRVPGRKFH